MTLPPADDVAQAAALRDTAAKLKIEIARAVVGQESTINELLVAVLAGGHCLLQGVPGLAKTLLAQTLASALDLKFARVQFTPDLMPSDITGTDILQQDDATGRRAFEFVKGPVFTNILLADEINRAPPKTQAALLQAMQERQVSTGGRSLELARPFFVIATQNPIEQEGTYPLPEAQLDRFMFLVHVGYPTAEEELEIYKRTTTREPPAITPVLGAAELITMQGLVRRVPIGEPAYQFALTLVRATRPGEAGASDFVRHWLAWGAGPRAGQFIVLAAKARALLRGQMHVAIDDIVAVTPAVLRHRLVPNFAAQAEGVTVDQIISKVIALVPSGADERLL